MLFSLVPFLALLVSVLDLVLPEDTRERLIHWLFGVLPGTGLEDSVDRALSGAGVSASVVGLVSLGVLLWAASGMMSSIRTAFRVIWEAEAGRPYVVRKLLDAVLVVGAGALVLAAFGLSVLAQVAVEAESDLASAIGWRGEGRALGGVLEVASSLLVIFVALLLVYRLVPPVHLRIAEVWPAALLVAVAFQLILAGFSFYLAHVASYSAVYGSLGAVFAFLVLVYVLAVLLLMGAEITRAIQR